MVVSLQNNSIQALGPNSFGALGGSKNNRMTINIENNGIEVIEANAFNGSSYVDHLYLSEGKQVFTVYT